MTEQQTPPTTGSRHPTHEARAPMDVAPSTGDQGLRGWVRFGGVMMTVIGAFGVIQGLVALLTPTTYLSINGTVLAIDLGAWGWVHLLLGVLLAVTGVSLLREAPAWARGTGVVLAALSTVVQLAWLPAYPLWSIIAIVLDVVVIYALVATSPER
jgi:hypothetical protein